MNYPEILFAITLGSFCIGILHRVWSISTAVSTIQHSFEKQDIRLENLVALHELGFNGFKERVDHTAARLRREITEVNVRVEDLESFMAKTTEFNRRR